MSVVRRVAVVLGAAGVLALAASCSSKGSTNPPPPVYTISKVTGDSQVAEFGTMLPAPIAVLVQDGSGAPAAGVTVSWALSSTLQGTVSAPSSTTDASGHAGVTWTLAANVAAKAQTVDASVTGGSVVRFTAFSQVGGAFFISSVSGLNQTDTVRSTLGQPFVVLVTDHALAPVPGVHVAFTPLSGGGSMSADTAITDVAGHAASTLTLGDTAETNLVAATVTGLTGSPVSLRATATAGLAAAMSMGTGNAQTAFRTTTLPNPHTVIVRDAYGNPVAGFTVHWVPGIGGGSVSDSTPVSGSDGVASTVVTLGDSTGSQTDTARAALAGSPITFTSTATVPPSTADVTVGPGISYAPTSVTVAVNGTVTWTWAPNSLQHTVTFLTAPGPLPAGSAVMTSGTFSVTFTQAGTYTYDCVIHGTAMKGTVIVL